MSCEINTQAMEHALECFNIAVLDDSEFRSILQEYFYSDEATWREKEYGRLDEDELDRIFEELWKYDCEGMFHDFKVTVLRYIKECSND